MPLSLVEEINDQRNRTYDLMQEPYARERAKAVDHQYGTDYLKVYDSMLEKYVDIDEYFQLPEPKYKKDGETHYWSTSYSFRRKYNIFQ